MTVYESYSLYIEALKALGGLLIPIALFMLGVLVHRYQKLVEFKLDHERDMFARRFMKFEEISSLANDIYCFTVLVGHYKAISPDEAIERKRKLEGAVYSTLPLWDDEFCRALIGFLDACFLTHRGRRMSIVSLSDLERHREERTSEWKTEWENLFLPAPERMERLEELFGRSYGSYRNDIVKPAYSRFLAALSKCLGGGLSDEAALMVLRPAEPPPAARA